MNIKVKSSGFVTPWHRIWKVEEPLDAGDKRFGLIVCLCIDIEFTIRKHPTGSDGMFAIITAFCPEFEQFTIVATYTGSSLGEDGVAFPRSIMCGFDGFPFPKENTMSSSTPVVQTLLPEGFGPPSVESKYCFSTKNWQIVVGSPQNDSQTKPSLTLNQTQIKP